MVILGRRPQYWDKLVGSVGGFASKSLRNSGREENRPIKRRDEPAIIRYSRYFIL
jgi:hypothetical protein